MKKQFLSFLRKEFYHIFRDKRTMLILLVMPIVLMILFGFAITTEVKDSRVAILDLSKDEVTAQLRERIAASRYFSITAGENNISALEASLRGGQIDVAVGVGEQVASELRRGGRPSVQILVDGTEPNQAAIRTGYMQQVLAAHLHTLTEGRGVSPLPGITPVVRTLYNPQGKSEYNFVPAVIGLVLMLICVMMTSIAIVREKEAGTMEVLLASPLPPLCIVLAKLVPYFAISCLNLTTILVLSVTMLHIPIAGSLPGFIAVSLLYILVALFLGLFISTVVRSQLAAMLLSLLVIIPTIYLSGILFPVESMPVALQCVSVIVPTRWYVDIARRLMIQGVELRYVWRETLVLLLMAGVLLGVSWKKFKIRLE